MLNGVAPILIFNFKKLLPQLDTSGIPLLSNLVSSVPLIPIPVYLDEKLTGIYIQGKNKNIDIKTDPDTLPDGTKPKTTQRGLASTVTINAIASQTSVGLKILLALSDQIFSKVTSQEYSVTYVDEAMSVFGGLLESFSAVQDENTSLFHVTLQISNAPSGGTVEKAAPLTLEKSTGALPLGA